MEDFRDIMRELEILRVKVRALEKRIEEIPIEVTLKKGDRVFCEGLNMWVLVTNSKKGSEYFEGVVIESRNKTFSVGDLSDKWSKSVFTKK